MMTLVEFIGELYLAKERVVGVNTLKC